MSADIAWYWQRQSFWDSGPLLDPRWKEPRLRPIRKSMQFHDWYTGLVLVSCHLRKYICLGTWRHLETWHIGLTLDRTPLMLRLSLVFHNSPRHRKNNKKVKNTFSISIMHAFISLMANVNTTCSQGMDSLPCSRQKSREMCSLPHQGPAMPVCNGIHPSLSKTSMQMHDCMKYSNSENRTHHIFAASLWRNLDPFALHHAFVNVTVFGLRTRSQVVQTVHLSSRSSGQIARYHWSFSTNFCPLGWPHFPRGTLLRTQYPAAHLSDCSGNDRLMMIYVSAL